MLLPSEQDGSVTIEFTLSFVILLALLYGIVGYTMPLLLSASYQQLASDVLREAMVWQHRQQATDAEVGTHIEARIRAASGSAVPCQSKSVFFLAENDGLWKVCLSPNPTAMLPPINLLGMQFPPLPEDIQITAALYTR